MVKKKAPRLKSISNKKLKVASNIKKVLVLLAGIFLIALAISIFSPKTLPLSSTPTPTQSIKHLKTLSDVLSYKAPSAWNSLTRSPDFRYETIYSPDYADDVGGKNIRIGARITLETMDPFEGKLSGNYSLHEIMSDYIPTTNGPTPTITTLTINGKEWANVNTCWEGCRDNFLTVHNNVIIRVIYECTLGECDTKYKSNSSRYASDRDSLLESIVFK